MARFPGWSKPGSDRAGPPARVSGSGRARTPSGLLRGTAAPSWRAFPGQPRRFSVSERALPALSADCSPQGRPGKPALEAADPAEGRADRSWSRCFPPTADAVLQAHGHPWEGQNLRPLTSDGRRCSNRPDQTRCSPVSAQGHEECSVNHGLCHSLFLKCPWNLTGRSQNGEREGLERSLMGRAGNRGFGGLSSKSKAKS